MTSEGQNGALDPLAEVIEWITAAITPPTAEVADWHFVDWALQSDWDRPLLRVLRFFVTSQADDPTDDANSTADVVDLMDVLNLTVSRQLDEELAS